MCATMKGANFDNQKLIIFQQARLHSGDHYIHILCHPRFDTAQAPGSSLVRADVLYGRQEALR